KQWKSLDDYSASLTNKYRKRLLKIRRAKEKLVVKKISAEEFDSWLPEIGALFQQTAENQFLKMGLIGASYFVEMKKCFPQTFVVNGYFSGSKLVAFSSYFDHREMLEVHYIGIDYKFNKEVLLYFNILYD